MWDASTTEKMILSKLISLYYPQYITRDSRFSTFSVEKGQFSISILDFHSRPRIENYNRSEWRDRNKGN